jgi:hypothetical protein
MNDLELLRALRDADAAPPDPRVRQTALRALEEHTKGLPVRSHGARRRRTTAAAIAIAAAAAIAIVTGLNGGRVDTPPASARAAVERAARAATEPGGLPPLAPGQYLYLRERDAYGAIAADARPGPFTVMTPELRESWIGRGGGGQIVVRSSGRTIFPGPRDRRRWEAAGRPQMAGPKGPPDTMKLADQGFTAGSHTLSYAQLTALPTGGAEMYKRLLELAGDAGPSPDAEAFTIIGDLLRSAPVPPEQRAGLYRAAAYIKGVQYAGEVKDPLGRKGLALDLANDSGRDRLIFDPETSLILAEESVLTKRVDYIDAPPGYPSGSRVVLQVGVADRAGARPAR